jgi:hypothetical protein
MNSAIDLDGLFQTPCPAFLTTNCQAKQITPKTWAARHQTAALQAAA